MSKKQPKAVRLALALIQESDYDDSVTLDTAVAAAKELRRLHELNAELLDALDGLMKYFESGNCVPVDQATIKSNSKAVIATRASIAKATKGQE